MTSSVRVVFVAAVVVATMSVLGGGDVTNGDAQVDAITYSGDTVVAVDGQHPLVWREGDHEFTVTVVTSGAYDGDVCLLASANRSDRSETLACDGVSLRSNGTHNVTVGVADWPEGLTGPQTVRGRVGNASERESATTVLTVLRESGDRDDDGLTNRREAALGTNLQDRDTDGDGLDDAAEVDTYGTDPVTNDTDGDGLDDAAEIDRYQTDPATSDTDGDGLPDPRELGQQTNPNRADTDGDGLADGAEVNVHGTDPLHPDTDGDGLDDGAEVDDHETNPLEADTDGDDLDDNLEVTTYGTAPNKVDTDGDGLTDGAEVYNHSTDPTTVDTDGDGLDDGAEVNVHETNPTTADTDGDGLTDGAEVHQYNTDPTAVDSDGDGQSDYAEVDPQSGPPLVLLTAGLAGLVIVATAGWSLSRSAGRFDVQIDGGLPAVPATIASGFGGPPDEDDVPDQDDEADQADETDQTDEQDPPSQDIPLELLPNEEQIRRLLAEHDGRIRQADVVDETDWSKSKVSRVLSEMEADGEIEKIDIGSGNVVTLADEVPEGAASPFDE